MPGHDMSMAEAIARIAEATGRCPSCDEDTIEVEHDKDGELVKVFCGDPNCGWISDVSSPGS